MRAPTLGSEVLILDKPKGDPVDDTRWTVWSQSPEGWWIFVKPADGGAVEWRDVPARLLKPARKPVISG